MFISIKDTGKVSPEGFPIVAIKSGDKVAIAEKIGDDDYREYDESISSISFSLEKETDENEVEILRKETKKDIIRGSNGGVIGIHTYTSSEDNFVAQKCAIVRWFKRKDKWVSSKATNLTPDDILSIANKLI